MLIIFDLDGTLIDSARDLALATNATRQHFHLPPLDGALIQSYVGNGVARLVERAMGKEIGSEQLAKAVKFFLSYYGVHALDNTLLYEGVRDLLGQLSADGHALAVLTNKPVKLSGEIITGLGIAHRFRRVYGGDSFRAKKPDPIGIRTLSVELGFTAEETMMVGDSGVDMQTARNAGVRGCGVLWGFHPEAVRTEVPDLLIDAPRELAQYARDGRFSSSIR